MFECVGNVNKPCLFVNNIKQKGGDDSRHKSLSC